MPARDITDVNEFKEATAKGLCLVDFWAPWCGPCQRVLPIMDQLSEEVTDAEILKVNVDENGEIAAEFGVRGIPAVLLFKDGKHLDTKIGAFSFEDYSSWVLENK